MKKLTKLMTLVLVFMLAAAPLAYALEGQEAEKAVSDTESTGSDPTAQEEEQTLATMAAKTRVAGFMATVQASTITGLQDAIDNSSPGDIIELTDDINLGPTYVHTITIPVGKSVTFTGGHALSATIDVLGTLIIDGVDIVHAGQGLGDAITVESSGELILNDGDITNDGVSLHYAVVHVEGSFSMYGGVIANSTWGVGNHGTFEMHGGIIEGNNIDGVSSGGGVHNYSDGTFVMDNGTIQNNEGTGVSNYGEFEMNGGVIQGNVDSIYPGGGVYNSAQFIMNTGTISNNRSDDYGGGVSTVGYSQFIMNGGVIRDNSAPVGGGICISSDAIAAQINGGTIQDNVAESSGGGIYIRDHSLLTVSASCTFSGNTAGQSDILDPTLDPATAAIYSSNIQCTQWSNGATYGYNDADISYEYPVGAVTSAVTVNGSVAAVTGAGDYPNGTRVTISAGTREGYTFAGWTVSPNSVSLANATAATTTFTMPATAVSLTATWENTASPRPQYTVTYNYNYSGAPAPTVITVDEDTLLGDATSQVTRPTRSGYTFSYWRFNADGTGVPDAATPIDSDTTLYAVWASDAGAGTDTDADATAMPPTGDNAPYYIGGASLALLVGIVLLRQRKRISN